MKQITQTRTETADARFKAPSVSRKSYLGMNGLEFYNLCDEVSAQNSRWARKNLGDSEWAIVRQGEILETGNKRVYPSAFEIRRHSYKRAFAYLIKRH